MALRLFMGLLGAIAASARNTALAGDATLDASFNKNGSYTVVVNGKQWLRSAPTFVTVGGKVYSTADGSLKMQSSIAQSAGKDKLGAWQENSITWTAGGTPFVTSIKSYDAGTVIFEQSFPEGIPETGAQLSGKDSAQTAFPSLAIDTVEKGADAAFGWVSFSGRFVEASKAGAWAPGTLPSGKSAGPFVLFDKSSEQSLVVSPFSNFMASMFCNSPRGSKSAAYNSGILGSITSLPKEFSYKTVMTAGNLGVTATMKIWGDLMLKSYDKPPAEITRAKDISLQVLGYSTDNGAFYYGNTERLANGTRVNYERTILDLQKELKAREIPVAYALYDSWWYYKGKGGGISNWTARPDVFPGAPGGDGGDAGMEYMHEQTGWPVQAHNRYWSPDTVYAKQNGGDFDFIVEDKMAIPLEQRFWDELMANGTEWGLEVYEQDWLYNEFEGLNATLQNATLSRDWLMQMGEAAGKVNVTIQYCMTYARMVLQSLEIPAVSQFRAGDDYHPGQSGAYPSGGCGFPYCVYDIGTSSLFAWAVGLAPSKDNFWSATGNETDSPYRDKGGPHEMYNEMEAAISAYSTGPVAFSDKIGRENKTLVMMTCTRAGLLLQPSRPASTLDSCFTDIAFPGSGPRATKNNNLPVWSTHTAVNGRKWAHVLVIGLNQSYDMAPAELAPTDLDDGSYVAWTGYGAASNVTVVDTFAVDSVRKGSTGDAAKLTLPAAGYSDFGLYHFAPVMASIAYLGETAKFVPVAVARTTSVTSTSAGLEVVIKGSAGEVVELAFAVAGPRVVSVACKFPQKPGAASISVASMTMTAKVSPSSSTCT